MEYYQVVQTWIHKDKQNNEYPLMRIMKEFTIKNNAIDYLKKLSSDLNDFYKYEMRVVE
jgi:hypothetical protein